MQLRLRQSRGRLEKSDRYNPNWFVLSAYEDNNRFLSIIRSFAEGPAEEWIQVAEALEEGEDIEFKRVKLTFEKTGSICFNSPKNTHGKGDYVRISKNLAKSLASQIRHELIFTREKCYNSLNGEKTETNPTTTG